MPIGRQISFSFGGLKWRKAFYSEPIKGVELFFALQCHFMAKTSARVSNHQLQ